MIRENRKSGAKGILRIFLNVKKKNIFLFDDYLPTNITQFLM